MGRPKLERITANCEHCGEPFEYMVTLPRRFCCHSCYTTYQSAQRPRVNCAWCGKEKAVSPNSLWRNEIHFCNRKCQGAWRKVHWQGKDAPQYKERERRVCPICHEKYEVRFPAQITCGFTCAGKRASITRIGESAARWAGGNVTVSCTYCGADIERQQCALKRSVNFFCDVKCRGAWQSIHNTGVDHPNWRGGYYNYRGENWETQRDKARKRDQNICQHCGKKAAQGQFHDVHHIRPFRTFGYIAGKNDNYIAANELSNLTTLCSSCHRIIDAQWHP